jgi:RNA polymerase sigma factor (sigma-70 family)
MTMMESQQLLADYVTNGSEEAFQELVARYVDLVYSTALRLVEGDPHRARDVAQTVFVDLARLAARLAPNSMLGGWLHRRTCFVARTLMRGERRRQARERQAFEMSALDNHPDTALAEIAPVLDEAIHELGADDRDAILLRFFERRSLRSVGEALGTSENVAQKRVARALQELAVLLKHRGFSLPAAALASGLATSVVKAAPAGLALALAKAALAGSAASGGIAAASAKAVAFTNLKTWVIGILIIGGIATILWLQHLASAKRRGGNQASPSPLAEQPTGAPRPPPAGEPVSQPPETDLSPNMAQLPVEPRAFGNVITDGAPIITNPTGAAPGATGGIALVQRFFSRPGSRVRIEGTSNSNRRSWQAESVVMDGFLEIEPDALEGQKEGRVQARAEVFVPVVSIKTIDKDGRPDSGKIDEAWYAALRAKNNPEAKIAFYLSALTCREPVATNGAELTFEAKGDLVMVGISNAITLPVRILPLVDGRLEISGAPSVRWVSEEVDPFAVVTDMGSFSPDPKVNVKFEWLVASTNTPPAAAQDSRVPLHLDLPAPAFKGTPRDLQLSSYVEPWSETSRPPMRVPGGLKNVAQGARVSSSDKNATAEALAKVVDADKEASEQSIIYLRKGSQWVQLDLGGRQEIFAIVIWHAHNAAKVYHDVIVQIADDADFLLNARTLFNNDQDNSSGLGKGADREYFETYEGKLIDAKGVRGGFLRFYSKGSTESALNEYTEIEVYGRPAQ